MFELSSAVDFVAFEVDKPSKIIGPHPAQKSQPVRHPAEATGPQSCLFDKAVPPCIRKAYGVADYHANTTKFNAQAVIVNQGLVMHEVNTILETHFPTNRMHTHQASNRRISPSSSVCTNYLNKKWRKKLAKMTMKLATRPLWT